MRVISIFDRTIDFLALLAAVLLIFIMLTVVYDVLMRYLMNRPTIWAGEIVEYSLLWITFLATAWVLKMEGHVKTDIVLSRLNPATQSVMNMITSILGAIICLVVTWYGIRVTYEYFQSGYLMTTELRPLMWPLLTIIPIGLFLFSMQFLRRGYGYLRVWRALRG